MKKKKPLDELYLQTAKNLGWTMETLLDTALTNRTPAGKPFGFYVSAFNGSLDFVSGAREAERHYHERDEDTSIFTEEEMSYVLSSFNELINAFAFTQVNYRPFNPLTDVLPDYRKMVIRQVQEEFDRFHKEAMQKSKEEIFRDFERIRFYDQATKYLTSRSAGDLFDSFCFLRISRAEKGVLESLFEKYSEYAKEELCSECDGFIVDFLFDVTMSRKWCS